MVKSEDWKETAKGIILNKKFQIGLVILIFLAILISSTMLRTSNLPILKDITTGKYLPADPDACYEYRIAQKLLDTGNLNGIDPMRNPGLNLTYAQEMLPKVLVLSYKALHIVGSTITLDKVDVLYPVVAFAIGLIIFFILCWYLSKSKWLAVVASALLAYSPSFLSRTTGGVSSHEALGIPFMFLAMLILVVSLNRFNKNWKQTLLWGIVGGISLALSFFSWSGASNFVILIIPVLVILYYLFGIEEEDLNKKLKFIVFNLVYLASSVIIMPIFGFSFSDMYSKFLSNYGILIPFILAFMIIDFLILKYKEKIKLGSSKYRIIYSMIITFVLGLIGLIVLGKNPLSMLNSIYTQLLFPLGLGRVGLTVAYFAQPYISDLISQYTAVIFWLFVLGMFFLGVETSKSISSIKHRWGFVISWTIAIFGMMFSRNSATSTFNGTNFISQTVYILSFVIFAAYFIWLYFNDKFKIDTKIAFLFAWMFVMLLSTRSAVRVIFVIYTFVAFSVAYAILKLYDYSKTAKDNLLKWGLYIASILLVLVVLVSLFGNPISHSSGSYQITKNTAASMGPIADYQWQNSMAWVRNNTDSQAIFAHWWDYGYQIQTMANRTTVLDGGNANTYWNYLMGRYVLTTPQPDTALSFLKSHNVSYFLIDPTDFGKYAAYSKIGSDNNWDRYSSPFMMISDSKQMTDTVNGTIRVYTGSSFVDEDVNYGSTFLPGPTFDQYGNADYKSYILGVILETQTKNNLISFNQPEVVFYYNNNQYRVPMRYVYFDGQIFDFKSGIESVFRIVPQLTITQDGKGSVDSFGTGIYLSSRVQKSLFARLYLMDDVFNQYPSIEKVNFEDDYYAKTLKSNGNNVGSFIYYNGLRSPLTIWKVNYPSNILDIPEFRAVSGGFGQDDNLVFTR